MIRTPIKIKRKSITMLTRAGHKMVGGTFAFKRYGEPPAHGKLQPSERVLWCPFCMDWTLWKQPRDDRGKWYCKGGCGWSNTDEYYVKMANDLWWEAVPLSEIKKIDLAILRPQKRR